MRNGQLLNVVASTISVTFSRHLGRLQTIILKLGVDGGGFFLNVYFTHIVMEESEFLPHSPLKKTIKLITLQTT